jgi:hypothetical protein
MPSIRATLADVGSLNVPDLPFSFAAQGDTIVGTWVVTDARYLTLRSAGEIDDTYTVTVHLDERTGTYRLEDRTVQGEAEVSLRDGKLAFGGERNAFRGRKVGRSFSFEAGGIYRKAGQEGLAPYLASSFDSDRITGPLVAFLEQHGWKRRKGFLAGLFG